MAEAKTKFSFLLIVFCGIGRRGESFDLQFRPKNDKTVRARFKEYLISDTIDVGIEEWFEDALSDLSPNSAHALRMFLRESGGSIRN